MLCIVVRDFTKPVRTKFVSLKFCNCLIKYFFGFYPILKVHLFISYSWPNMLIRGYVTENTKLLCYLSSSAVVGDRIFIPSDVILQCSRAVPLLSSTSFSPCFDIAAFFCRSQVLFLIAGYFSARLPSKGSTYLCIWKIVAIRLAKYPK